MKKLKYNWEHGENKYQEYYDVYVGKEYLCVDMNKWTPGTGIGEWLLTSADPQYMMRKVEWCYAHKLSEISE